MGVIFLQAIAGNDFSYHLNQLVWLDDVEQAKRWIAAGICGVALDEDWGWPPSQ